VGLLIFGGAARRQKARTMASWIRRRSRGCEGGFSLVEVLIVIIVMGILAAIAVPLFIFQRGKAEDASTRTDVDTIGKELSAYWTENVAAPTIVMAADPSGAARTWHLLPSGVSTVDSSNHADTLIAAVGDNVAPTLSRGTDWDFSGSNRYNWCFWAYNPQGRAKGFWITAAAEIQDTGGGADNQCL
jgi:prepilin-type N-terminal cleavage/methylation domain-containing protein